MPCKHISNNSAGADNYYHRNLTRIRSAANYIRSRGATAEGNRIDMCLTGLQTFYDPTTQTALVSPLHCGSQFCPVCGPRRRAILKADILAQMQHWGRNQLRMITLTQVARTGESLDHASKRFRRSLTRCTRRRYWRTHVHGMIIKHEVNHNLRRNWWHYHVHIIAQSRWIDVNLIRAIWSDCSPGAKRVKVDPVYEGAERELAKYVSKIPAGETVPLAELIDYLAHHRMIAWTGSMRKYRETLRAGTADNSVHKIYLGPLDLVLDRMMRHPLLPEYEAVGRAILCYDEHAPPLPADAVTIAQGYVRNCDVDRLARTGHLHQTSNSSVKPYSV